MIPGTNHPKLDIQEDMDACFTAFDKDCDGYLNLSEFECICRALFRNDRGRVYSLGDEQVKDVFEIFDLDKMGTDFEQQYPHIQSVSDYCEGLKPLTAIHHNIISNIIAVEGSNTFAIIVSWTEMDDGKISRDEFTYCWNNWIKTIVRPVSAFLVIDVQNDFISGSLSISQCAAQQNGLDVVPPINRLLDTVNFDAVFYSLDWHPSDHVSFIDNLPNRKVHPTSAVSAEEAQTYDTVTFDGPHLMNQRLWPRHCVQESWGAELHKDLKIVENSTKVYKGTNPEVDSYSVFWDNKKLTQTTLSAQLAQKGATDVYVCGLAYDVCVGATAVDALSIGYRTILIDDCCRGVDLNDIERTKKTIVTNHGCIINSDEVKAMVEGRDRRPELGYKLALELKKKLEMGDEGMKESPITSHIKLSEEEVVA